MRHTNEYSALTAFFSRVPDLVKMFGFFEELLLVSVLFCGVFLVRDGEWARPDVFDGVCDSELV